jgi:hypothetical protein
MLLEDKIDHLTWTKRDHRVLELEEGDNFKLLESQVLKYSEPLTQ